MSNSSRRKLQAKRKSQGSVRIIAGELRGSKVVFSDADGLRPTPDRVRETLFNWLAPYIVGARCLDLFAGSAALSFEAISRGASEVVALEQNRETYRGICENQQRLGVVPLQVIQGDAIEWLKAATDNDSRFDIIFVDPPFHSGVGEDLPALIEGSGYCAPGAVIYLERPVDDRSTTLPGNWQLLKQRLAGQVRFELYERAQ